MEGKLVSYGMADAIPLLSTLVESSVLEILKLRQQCTLSLSDEIVRRVRLIREKCQLAEKQETSDGGDQIAWRRSGGISDHSGGSNGSDSGNYGSNSLKKSNRAAPNWRGPPAQYINKQPSLGRQSNGSSSSSDRPNTKYVSKFTNLNSQVEDKILNQIILNKLNKFSQLNYQEVKAFLEQILDSNESEFLRDFMLLVFKKAACEPTFCPLYAQLISELSGKYNSLLKELELLYSEYLTIFEEVNEEHSKDYETFMKRNREKIHRLGYSQFLGELTSMGVLNETQIHNLYITIFYQIKVQATLGEAKQQLVEEYVDCLHRMSKSFQKGTTHKLITLRQGICSTFGPDIEKILADRTTKYPGLSKKASFGLMDCLDLFKGEKLKQIKI
jgi:hypothetical protein